MIQKIIALVVFYISTSCLFAGNNLDSLHLELSRALANKNEFILMKEQRINELKQGLRIAELLPDQKYSINLKLFGEYKKYQSDSAYHYIQHNYKLAEKENNRDWLNETKINLAWYYSTKGDYIVSKEMLDNLINEGLSANMLALYYETEMEFYSHYGQSIDDYHYYKKSEDYRDSLLTILAPESLKYKIMYGARLLYSGDRKLGATYVAKLIPEVQENGEEYALLNYLLGFYYKMTLDLDREKEHFLKSAISDIKNATKDHASLQNLALLYYKAGDINNAYLYIQSTIEDASFFNAHYRTVAGSTVFSIINESYLNKEHKQKSDLKFLLIFISVLSLFLIFTVVYIYKQMKNLSLTRKQLHNVNQQLIALNNDLNNVNKSLIESNYVKEEYIAHFFDTCSNYIDKFGNYQKELNKKAKIKDMEGLYRMLKSSSLIDEEIEALYKNFDEIFLNIYPDFVEEFNKLLKAGDEIWPKEKELLNTELRIFALIRLGITDSVKISSFLRYSLRTVYNYRTKVRNKSSVPRDSFEEKIKEIGLIQNK